MDQAGYFLKLLPALALVTLVWALYASPFLLAVFFAAKFLRRRSSHPALWAFFLSFLFALLAAPVPTPIITFFIPMATFLFSSEMHTPFHSEIREYAVYAFFITWIIAFLVIRRYVAAFGHSHPKRER